MKLSVSAYRAHASAHKKILNTAYQLNYGSTAASHSHNPTAASNVAAMLPTCSAFQIDPTNGCRQTRLMAKDDGSSDDTPLNSPPSRDDDDSSNANESDCKSPSQRTKSNQRWMKLRTTVQISSAIQKKPPLKREDSFLKRFSSRQIPETQETVEDTGSECNGGGDSRQVTSRRRRRNIKQPRTVVNPDSNFYFYWLLTLTLCVLYNLWTLIVRQSFPELQNMIANFWLFFDTVSDLMFLFDLVVQLRTGYLEQGLMVYDSKKLACHYLRSRAFLLDLAALCPLDLLQIRFGSHPMLRCPRFLKVYRAVNYYYMVESRTVWPNLWRVINLIHILLILAHWFGCFYFLLSEAEGFQGDWVYPYRPGDYATLTRKYLGSLYWSTLTLTTIGDLPTPETNAEYIFTIVSYLIGVFIFATIVGQVGNVITNRNANRLEFERLLDGAKTYMRHHKVPGGMKRRVLRWYDYSWSRGRIQGGGDINTALGLLPDKLKTELALHVNLTVLKKVTIFQECQPEFLRDLVLKMKAYIFTPGDSICRKGEVAREMFIIADGILEVLSEHGKVLTTMKAGDFFGEIGILNLDGFNKRTADVRSVGYSELFSLSREDVLAAMKDYPEAQEILQALGRKRLMEVKASARHPPHHKEHHHHVPDPKCLVDKIKNEAKGLRNVLKKSRTHRRSEESLELQPLHQPPKATLKRMSRVKSHDLSQEDHDRKDSHEETATTAMTSPLGAGLPLLHRLRLLKEKQENEERSKGATSPILSPSSVNSPPPVSSVPNEPIGAGLPLLQRILMLKAKEEKESASCSGEGLNSVAPRTGSRGSLPKISKISLRERLKLHNSAAKETTPITAKEAETIEPSIQLKSDKQTVQPSNEPHWSKLKKAAISRDLSDPSTSASALPTPSKESDTTCIDKTKPNLVLTMKTKHYRSVDDLSPEYGGLPFVKKLKILNERQKLEELETVMKTRSFSLDIPETTPNSEIDVLTRSHSEGSTMHHQKPFHVPLKSPLHSSNESNETWERRHLKSILKKLSEETSEQTKVDAPLQPKKKIDSMEFRKLMRAPTIEGYAARHSKLSKSVTFNRDTLQSPPNSATMVGAPQNLFTYVHSSIDNSQLESRQEKIEHLQVKLIKSPLDDDQKYFADILLAIKQVMSAHLQDMQGKFHHRFEKLEEEVRNRDEIINRLREHICELEKNMDESITDSFETIVGNKSWEEHRSEEIEELQDLPKPIWSPTSASLPQQNVILDIDSTTSDSSSTSTSDNEDPADVTDYDNTSTNWEIELLAEQMRKQRSASLDHNSGRPPPLRKRLTRGGSVGND